MHAEVEHSVPLRPRGNFAEKMDGEIVDAATRNRPQCRKLFARVGVGSAYEV
jgi:hypothetical protein